ncbi:MAG: carbamoyltransferase HypF [Elusimicrobia bacterium]|nr:carbamoyltransferase HypF [Elusimicrobiota bacterium]
MGKDKAVRVEIVVSGVVQGVGFRPFIYKRALAHGLGGWVRNTGEGVKIQVQGRPSAVAAFVSDLKRKKPPQSRIDRLSLKNIRPGVSGPFEIKGSAGGGASAIIPADLAVCPDCVREMSDAADRRYLYPFTNCTNCGPRFTIVKKLPYDRPHTTMAGFPMCPDCRREYSDPLDRRFHAQPNACPVCGPQVYALIGGRVLKGGPALQRAADILAGGGIAAIKSLGGYHLACAADNAGAVSRLRAAKDRPSKPFAVMFSSLSSSRRRCRISTEDARLLSSPQAPIVMLSKKKSGDFALCAPGLSSVGVMLPYTPLHFVLFRLLEKTGFSGPLLMTSGNLKDEPICMNEKQASGKLTGMADIIVSHDRPIHNRCDDSVVFTCGGAARFVRRARGYVPQAVPLAQDGPAVLGCGAQLKNTFCLARGKEAFPSQHIGDLDDSENAAFYLQTLGNMKRLLDVKPAVVAYDLHPDYAASRIALSLPGRKISVQHHFAHIASVMAEHGLDGPVLGAALDGTGYGPDATVWGCEFLRVDGANWERLGTLRQVPLPGGDAAVLEIWRMGLSWARACYGNGWRAHAGKFFNNLPAQALDVAEKLCAHGVNSPMCGSMGRLFDAAAFFAGLGSKVSYEAQAAMELEALYSPARFGYAFEIARQGGLLVADPSPVIKSVMKDSASPKVVSGRFHKAVADMTVEMLSRLSRQTGIRRAALSGGVFQNRVLLQLVADGLKKAGLKGYFNSAVPANDGGISLGQCWAARKALQKG